MPKNLNTTRGQSKLEFEKNYKRVKDIVSKSGGDENIQISLAKKQANLITDEVKCINRAMAAKELDQEVIFDIFFNRHGQNI